MAVHNQNPREYMRPEITLGLRIGETTVIGVHSKTYTCQCSCGAKLNRKITARTRPERCGACAKKLLSDSTHTSQEAEMIGLEIRDMTDIEVLMVKEFEGTLTDKEKTMLSVYRRLKDD